MFTMPIISVIAVMDSIRKMSARIRHIYILAGPLVRGLALVKGG
jgi:hypothetical protein